MTQHEWLKLGITNGWCSPPICITHDGYPSTQEEDEEFEKGFDPCIHVIRPYEDETVKHLVEENCSPTIWRAAPYETES